MRPSRPTVVFLHAHPDDECILTGATIAKASAAGIRTIVAYATRGDAGETSADLGGETLGDRRAREAEAACAVLGVDRIEWLGHADSGMDGTDTTEHPEAFCNTDPEVVAQALADRLAGEDVLAVVGYDDNGTYGHPDHKQIHVLAGAAARALGAPWVLDATYNREHLASLPDADGSLDPSFAAAEADLTHFVTGDPWVATKLAAIQHHRSQIPDDWDTERPDVEGFRRRFGTEWFIVRPAGAGTASGDGAAAPAAAELGPLATILDPKADWVPPVLDGDPEAGDTAR